MIYSFRGYAHFCQCKFINALNDLNTLPKLGYQLDPASQYNLHLLQGIAEAQNNNFHKAIHHFDVAAQARHEPSDPVIYKCLTKLGEYNRNPKTKDRVLLGEALDHITHAIAKETENSNSHYLASAILYSLEQQQ